VYYILYRHRKVIGDDRMNFQYLVESCVAQFKDEKITKKNAEAIIRNVFDDIMQALKAGQRISIRGFGAFDVVEKKARVYVEPRTQKRINKEATNYPKFIPSGLLKDAVK
jgi:nucleoid DNA-binding protein